MLYISTSKIKESTVGSSFTVTYSANPESVEELKALHSTYLSVNMCEFTIKASSEKPNNCETCKHWERGAYSHYYCARLEMRQECHYEPKTEPQTDEEYINNLPWTEAGNGEQTNIEIARAIVHKAIDDAVIAEDAYPDLRQKMHDAVDNYEPQTEVSAQDYERWVFKEPQTESSTNDGKVQLTDCAWGKGE